MVKLRNGSKLRQASGKAVFFPKSVQHLPGVRDGRCKNLDSGVQMGGIRINNIRYADDTTLLELIYDKLQISTNKLVEVCGKWGMKSTQLNAES